MKTQAQKPITTRAILGAASPPTAAGVGVASPGDVTPTNSCDALPD